MLIFYFGGALSIYDGARKILDPKPTDDTSVNFANSRRRSVVRGLFVQAGWREISRAAPLSALRAVYVILWRPPPRSSGLG